MSKRAEAEMLWLRVVAGEFDDPAVRTWLVTVAEKLLQADDEPDDNLRRAGYGDAVGLKGRKRPKRDPAELRIPLIGFGLSDSMTDAEKYEKTLQNFADAIGERGSIHDPYVRNRLQVRRSRVMKALSGESVDDGGDFDPDAQ